jgi:hypothetical protein
MSTISTSYGKAAAAAAIDVQVYDPKGNFGLFVRHWRMTGLGPAWRLLCVIGGVRHWRILTSNMA